MTEISPVRSFGIFDSADAAADAAAADVVVVGTKAKKRLSVKCSSLFHV